MQYRFGAPIHRRPYTIPSILQSRKSRFRDPLPNADSFLFPDSHLFPFGRGGGLSPPVPGCGFRAPTRGAPTVPTFKFCILICNFTFFILNFAFSTSPRLEFATRNSYNSYPYIRISTRLPARCTSSQPNTSDWQMKRWRHWYR